MLTKSQTKSLRKLITEARNAFADRTLLESEGYGPAVLRAQEASDKAAERLERALDKLTISETNHD